MWVSKAADWHKNHTDLTKYFFEKIKQQVDYEELISNTHRTTNGYTLIKEIIDVANLTLKRKKSFKRLETLINESVDKVLISNIANDYILQNYHSDIPEYYKRLKITDDEKVIGDVYLKSKIFFYRLSRNYYDNIVFEIEKIDFNNVVEFERNAKVIDRVIDVLIPYLLFVGYSPSSISDIAFRMIKKQHGINSPKYFLNNFQQNHTLYDFLLIIKKEQSDYDPFATMLERKEIDYNSVKIDTYKKLSQIRPEITSGEYALIEFSNECKDPQNYIRYIYEKTLRTHLLEHSRLSLNKFNGYFDNVYWRFSSVKTSNYQQSSIKIDPINVNKRKNTLLFSLQRVSNAYGFSIDEKLPIITEIQDSVYYYNLALGSKSIENSLFLLWSSLESLVPYRFKHNDIENVQYFVSRFMSIGALGRLISSFAVRYIENATFNKIDYKKLGINPYIQYSPEGFSTWANWLSDSTKRDTVDDPFNEFKKASNLLCKQYSMLNDFFSGHGGVYKVEDISKRMQSSYKSIEYQLDRIYLHRNQIVHSGKFINEYSNLWLHLEWYVGKLLSYLFIKYYNAPEHFSKEKAFMELDGDYDLLVNLLERYKSNSVKHIHFAYDKILEHTWQFF